MFVDALKGQIHPLSKRNTGRSRAILSTPIKHHNLSNIRVKGQSRELWRVLLSRVGSAGQAVEWVNTLYIVPNQALTLPVLVVCHRPKILDSIASRIGRIAVVVFCMYPSVTLLTA